MADFSITDHRTVTTKTLTNSPSLKEENFKQKMLAAQNWGENQAVTSLDSIN